MEVKQLVLAAGTAVAVLLAGSSTAEEKFEWSYKGKSGPEHWGELDPAFSRCSEGKNQSPIDLSSMVDAKLPPIGFFYRPGGTELVNNGRGLQVNYEGGSHITLEGEEYYLSQLQFHSPSEHTIEGEVFPLEAQFMHTSAAGSVAIVAVMLKEGNYNEQLGSLWDAMPKVAGSGNKLDDKFDAKSLLPKKRDYYRYNGSLTTPPCSEGVTWLVTKKPQQLSKYQIQEFQHIIQPSSQTNTQTNNRPLQPKNARLVID